MENHDVTPKIKNDYSAYQPLMLASNNTEVLCPIEYIYDYLPLQAKWLKSQPVSLRRLFAVSEDCNLGFVDHQAGEKHSINLDVKAAKIPLHSGLEVFRQGRYWRANEKAAREVLELLAQDRRCSEVILCNKQSMASLFEEQLRTATIHTYSRFSIYMFAKADENQSELLAQCMILIFAFDDMWENTLPKTMEDFREDFVSRLRGNTPPTTSDTPLERRLNAIREGLLAGDKEEGNGGAEILQTLIDFCYHADAREDFGSVRNYLDYRWEDIANSFTWACAKFSIRSSVDQHSPNLNRMLRLLGDQISIVNDIASYEKEKRRFETGRATSMINLVHVIMKIERMEVAEAKSMAYAWQLCTENEILEELGELKKRDELTDEDWRFLEACLLAASGSLLTSVVIARYGGEDARIR